jgi:hypothetical protein
MIYILEFKLKNKLTIQNHNKIFLNKQINKIIQMVLNKIVILCDDVIYNITGIFINYR